MNKELKQKIKTNPVWGEFKEYMEEYIASIDKISDVPDTATFVARQTRIDELRGLLEEISN